MWHSSACSHSHDDDRLKTHEVMSCHLALHSILGALYNMHSSACSLWSNCTSSKETEQTNLCTGTNAV
eukprot:c31073_g1_i1 orf=1-201(-)